MTTRALALGTKQAVLTVAGDDGHIAVATYGWLLRPAEAEPQPHSGDILICLQTLHLVKVHSPEPFVAGLWREDESPQRCCTWIGLDVGMLPWCSTSCDPTQPTTSAPAAWQGLTLLSAPVARCFPALAPDTPPLGTGLGCLVKVQPRFPMNLLRKVTDSVLDSNVGARVVRMHAHRRLVPGHLFHQGSGSGHAINDSSAKP